VAKCSGSCAIHSTPQFLGTFLLKALLSGAKVIGSQCRVFTIQYNQGCQWSN
jgi:hypothetical protein